MFRCVRLPSTFSARNLRLLWLTEPLPTSALIVLFIKSHFLSPSGRSRGSVTLVKSNAKALLTACGHQKVLLRSPRGLWGFAPATAVASPAGLPFEKVTLHPAETSVTVCDDGDGIFDTAPAHRNIVTPSHIVTIALSLQALQCARSECGCFHIGCRTHSAAVRR